MPVGQTMTASSPRSTSASTAREASAFVWSYSPAALCGSKETSSVIGVPRGGRESAWIELT